MKSQAHRQRSRVLTLLLVLLPGWAGAVSLGELQSTQHLEIRAQLIPATDIVVGQRVELVISIATDRWFAGGTRLEIPEVAGLVILQTNEFATNSSENRGGQSWVVQHWSLDVFPQRDRSFIIPTIKARLTVNNKAAGNIEGELQSPSVKLHASVPTALQQVRHWVAAPSFTVSQSFDKDLDTLNVGDAFERKISFEATEVMAMMLPAFTAGELPGLAAYPQPSELANTSNRGSMLARRVEHITYVVEQQGNYQLPARDYYWWDTRAGELQMRFLPAVDIRVGKGSGTGSTKQAGDQIAPIDLQKLLMSVGVGTVIIGLGWLLYTRRPRPPWERITGPINLGWRRLNQMRRPALPASLNPHSNDGE